METEYPHANNIKLIVTDVDGSLLNSKGEFSPQSAKIIRKVLEQYPTLRFVLSTGRAEGSLRFIRDALNLDQTNLHPVCGTNGCLIYSGDFKLLNEFFIEAESVVKLINFCENELTEDISFAIYSENDVHFFKEDKFSDIFQTLYNEKVVIMEKETLMSKIQNHEIHIHKICILHENISILKDKIQPVIDLPGVRMFQTSAFCLEAMPKDGNKGTALKKLLEIYHIKPEEVIAFGDGENDIPMFNVSGHSVAMGNAVDLAKKHSNYVTKSNDENGVAVFLEKVFLK